MTALLAAVVAALIGAAGPSVIARLPEPPADSADFELEEEPKIPYVDLARAPHLAWWLAGTAALLAGVAATQVPTELVPAWVLFCGTGVWLAYVDLRTRLLPYLIVAPTYLALLALVGLGALLVGEWQFFVHALLANAIIFGLFWLIYQLGRLMGGAFGYGDVRLSGSVGLVLGPLGYETTLAGSYAIFVVGAVVSLLLVAARRVGLRTHFGFGPFMIVGPVAGLLWVAAIG